MRRLARSLFALAILPGLLLAGCHDDGVDDTASGDGSGGDAETLASVTLSGPIGALPTFEFTTPLVVTAGVARVANAGTGAAIESGDAVLLDVASVSGTDATALGDSYSGAPQMLVVDEESFPAVLLDILLVERVGARLLYAAPDEDGGTVISSFDVLSAHGVLDRAEGESVAPVEGLPEVTLANDGRPAMQPVATAQPTETIAQPLIVGDGEKVESDAWLAYHYSCWSWDGAEIASSWRSGPLVQLLSGDSDGWQDELIGLSVGSQVLLITPPGVVDPGETNDFPADAALVFVIDILTVVNPMAGGTP